MCNYVEIDKNYRHAFNETQFSVFEKLGRHYFK